ncbi:MAG: M1 family metallopeptidase [Vitreimonas sp.]
MLKRRTLLQSALAAPLLSACTTVAPGEAPEPYPAPVPDPDSYAQPAVAHVTHVALDLTADFQRKVLHGTATLSIEAAADAREVVLDCDKLTIQSVRTEHGPTTHTIGAVHPEHGAPLTIAITPDVRTLTIAYETSPEAGALQWLSAQQTASGKPYLFSQGESILTRSWVPTQDSPGIRQSWEARIVVPAELKTVMSAEMLTPDGEAADAGMRAYRFRMVHPVPTYLMAIAVGDLAFRSTGPRTGVWSEPSVVDAAAREFSDMERMVRVAETLYGPYRWGRYDVLVLPPSFPYGGMENPRLTFATPTIIAGDKSLVNVIAHELAHSWSGNLVTNAVWADAWMNEGFTTYIEGRISEALYGTEQVAMAYTLDWVSIQTALHTLQPDATRLHKLPGFDPDGGSSAIDYGKASLFLRTIEGIIGRTQIDTYLRSYFDRHAFQPITAERFLADFRTHVVRGDAALEQRLMLDQWVYQPGLPSNAVEPHAAAFDRVAAAVNAFNAGGAASALPWSSWGTLERQRFLQTLPRTITQARLDDLEHTLHLNAVRNDEVLFDWLKYAIRNDYHASEPAVRDFLTRQGRVKYLAPLYRALMAQGAWGPVFARQVYSAARAGYHPVAQAYIDRVVTQA